MRHFGGLLFAVVVLAQPCYAQSHMPEDPLEEILNRKPTPVPSRENTKLKAFLNQQLLQAVKAGDQSEVRYCLDKGADISIKDEGGSSLVKLSIDTHDVLEELIKRGVDIDAPIETVWGNLRPIIFAIDANYRSLLTLLLKHHVKLDGPEETGGSALLRFVKKTPWADAPVASRYGFKALVEAGADLAFVDLEGKSLVDHCQDVEGFPQKYISFIVTEQPREPFAKFFESELAETKAQAKREFEEAKKKLAFAEDQVRRLQALARKGPLHILGRTLEEDDLGTSKASIKVYNAWKKTIDAFTVEIRCTNNFGRPVHGYGFRPYFKGICQDEIEYDAGGTVSWTLYGYDTATSFSARIMEVHFTDGSTWRPRR